MKKYSIASIVIIFLQTLQLPVHGSRHLEKSILWTIADSEHAANLGSHSPETRALHDLLTRKYVGRISELEKQNQQLQPQQLYRDNVELTTINHWQASEISRLKQQAVKDAQTIAAQHKKIQHLLARDQRAMSISSTDNSPKDLIQSEMEEILADLRVEDNNNYEKEQGRHSHSPSHSLTSLGHSSSSTHSYDSTHSAHWANDQKHTTSHTPPSIHYTNQPKRR